MQCKDSFLHVLLQLHWLWKVPSQSTCSICQKMLILHGSITEAIHTVWSPLKWFYLMSNFNAVLLSQFWQHILCMQRLQEKRDRLLPIVFRRSSHWLMWGNFKISFHFLLLPLRFPPPPAEKERLGLDCFGCHSQSRIHQPNHSSYGYL